MEESDLHFIWKTRLFDFRHLTTISGESVEILQVGVHNFHQGPDFLQAKVRIGGMEWQGAIEIHVHSKEWYLHRHHLDAYYNNVVLHVVAFSSHQAIMREDGTEIPEIVIGEKIPLDFQKTRKELEESAFLIPCANLIHQVDSFTKTACLTQMAIARIEDKASKMEIRLKELQQDWAQLIWENLMLFIGGTHNQDVLLNIAQTVPYSIIQKYSPKIFPIEAILWGAYWDAKGENLEAIRDTYMDSLWEEYLYLKNKHSLRIGAPMHFTYFRMHPANFPDIRVAQIAALLAALPSLMDGMQKDTWTKLLRTKIVPSEYWKTHYKIGQKSSPKPKPLGKETLHRLMINIFVPLGFLYRKYQMTEDAPYFVEEMLMSIPPEKNHITTDMESVSFSNLNSLTSQGMIHLKKFYCDEKRCLDCSIGYQLLRGKR